MVIRSFRERAEMTQLELAKAVGVSQPTVAGWESGRYLPASKLLPKLAKLFHCSIDDLFGEDEA